MIFRAKETSVTQGSICSSVKTSGIRSWIGATVRLGSVVIMIDSAIFHPDGYDKTANIHYFSLFENINLSFLHSTHKSHSLGKHNDFAKMVDERSFSSTVSARALIINCPF